MDQAIAAIATGQERSAIGVIRLSGEGCIQALERVFRCADGAALACQPARTLILGTLLDREGRALDQAMAVFFPAPHSYTGEDACELHCHGSPAVLTLALEALFAQGVRQALPGEFTKRAFLNGKLDLTGAEAVADLIDAATPAAARQAAAQLGGALLRQVEGVYQGLVDLLAHFHAALDYPDEDIAPLGQAAIRDALASAAAALAALKRTYRRGQVVKEGVPTAIVGRPNVGKSTLLNALVGFDRAIVTDLPGTTRDTVEERCVLGDTVLRLMDTAGLRETADPVEQLGVERARTAMESAGLILVVLDRTQPVSREEEDLIAQAKAVAPTVVVWNKCDLSQTGEVPDLTPAVSGSAKADPEALVEALAQAVAGLFPQGEEGAGVLANLRQMEAADRALQAVETAQAGLEQGQTPDILLTDVEQALSALAQLTGRSVREDVIERIFQRFCVGK